MNSVLLSLPMEMMQGSAYGKWEKQQRVGVIQCPLIDVYKRQPLFLKSTMNSISSAKAVIFDLRNNGGGSPLLVQLILSYLLEPKTHYNSVFNRIKNTISEYRTYQINTGFESEGGIGSDNKEGKLNGKINSSGLIKAPVYVLTAKRTFSAAEEFAYDIQSIKRGKIAVSYTHLKSEE